MTIMLNHIDIICSDVLASVAFYRQVGLEIGEDKLYWEGDVSHHVEVDAGGGLILGLDSESLTKGYDANWEPGGASRNFFIFAVPTREAVDAKHDEMVDAGYASHKEPFDAFWGSRYAIVDDPDGNHVGFMSPREEH